MFLTYSKMKASEIIQMKSYLFCNFYIISLYYFIFTQRNAFDVNE